MAPASSNLLISQGTTPPPPPNINQSVAPTQGRDHPSTNYSNQVDLVIPNETKVSHLPHTVTIETGRLQKPMINGKSGVVGSTSALLYSLNLGGAGDKFLPKIIKSLTQLHRIEILAILEPRISGDCALHVVNSLGFTNHCIVDANGF
ncbi:unnamed protein product [Prunus brigantina]